MTFSVRLVAILALISVSFSGCISHPSAPVTDLSPLSKKNKTYVVAKGDTLHAIAFRTGVAYQKIAAWNGIVDPYRIYVGDVLSLRQSSIRRKQTKTIKRSVKARTKLASKPIKTARLPSNVSKWRWPAKGKLTQKFSKSKAIFGIQIKAKRASPVLATASGQVVYTGSAIKGYGKMIIVKHSEKFISAYAHNDTLLVKEGDQIKAGQQLAKMGSSGTKGVKLHFEIRKNGEPVNPLNYLPQKRG